jgi:hypothetical protein
MPASARITIGVLAFALVWPVGAAEPSRHENMDLARRFGKLLANGGPDRVADRGLLVLHVDWIDKRWIGREPAPTEFVVELSATNGGPVGTIAIAQGKPGIGELPAGRHCITGLRSPDAQVRVPCEAPYFDVSARSVDIGGRIEIEVKGSKARIAWRDVEDTWNRLELSPAQETQVADFLGRAQDAGYRTYFLSMPLAPPRIVRLRPDGSAEYEEHSLANASYTRGKWRPDRTIEADFHDGLTRLSWSDAGAHQRVRDQWWHRLRDGLAMFALEEHWAATTRIECWDWRACGARLEPGLVISPEFGTMGVAQPLDGRIRLAFSLAEDRGTRKPIDVEIVDSTLDAATSLEVALEFGDARFLADPAADTGTARWTLEVAFRPDGDRAESTFGALRPAAPAAGAPASDE